RGTDRLNHHLEESHDDVVHHVHGLDLKHREIRPRRATAQKMAATGGQAVAADGWSSWFETTRGQR
ncbi:hypothetical protein, partial [Mycolicibacterium elephantis]|uniref:hypothetical protein n=1 Tax=Mycolicibacterium elephantis TaxID=81858 RepID=UPI001A990562